MRDAEITPMRRLLLIDDHPFFLEGLKVGLESLAETQFSVAVMPNAKSALQLGAELELFDLILCDLNLPEMNGIEFIKALIERERFVRVAILSASEYEDDVQRAMSVGAAGFINKGIDAKEIHLALEQILSGQRYTPDKLIARPESVLKREIVNIAELGITDRQYEVLIRLADGMSNKEISEQLSIKESTVKSHLQVLFQVLNVTNRTACIVEARSMGLLALS